MSSADHPILTIQKLRKSYGPRLVLDGIDLAVRPGEFVAVLGASGAGKTTLFKAITGLTAPDDGRIEFAGTDLTALRGRDLRLARRQIGFVFQQFNLIRRVDALANVLGGRLGYTPTWRVLTRCFSHADVTLAHECLAAVGLAEFAFQRTDRLSGGQQQRVAIARALAQQCRFILADEPVASLDPDSSKTVLQSLRSIAKTHGLGVLCSLHQTELATAYADRVVGLRGGVVVCDRPADEIDQAALDEIYVKRSDLNDQGRRAAGLGERLDNPELAAAVA